MRGGRADRLLWRANWCGNAPAYLPASPAGYCAGWFVCSMSWPPDWSATTTG